MNSKAYSIFEIKSVSEPNGGKRTFKGIASTPTPDRVQDIVEPKGASFKLPIPFLWQHNSADPIGWITKATVTGKGIDVEGEVADVPESGELKERLLKAWQMLKNKLVQGLSIGFKALEYAWIDGTEGMHITKWEWLELSAVTIPANMEATITAIKSAASGYNLPGVSGQKTITKGKIMNLREQLKTLEDSKALKIKRLGELSEIVKGGTAGEAENFEIDTLTGEIEKLDTDIRMKKVEVMTCDSAHPVTSSVKTAPNIITHKSDVEEKFKGQSFTRILIAKAVGHLDQISPLAVAEKRWGRSNPMLVSLIKTAVAGGGSGSGEWGAELVAADARFTGDFIEYLNAMTVFDRLGLREVPANVTIKGQDGAGTGYWVGESKPILASAQSFSAVSLTPLKVAALAVVSNELLRDSTPAAEQLVRDAIVEACSQKIDTTFFSTAAISAGVSPAGILNGLAAGSSAGTDADGLRADIKALYASFIAAKNASGLKLVMNPALAKAIQLLTNTLGLTEFPGITQNGGTLLGDTVVTGDNINANHIILLKPSDIYRIADTGIQVSISREAMIEMDDAPAGASDTPVGASTAMVSMFQSESTALKVVRPINFQLRRAGAVAYISDADYGAVSS
jgi:HK97 family phage major capsid protein/HK97 family phage prohead protease